MTVVGIPWMPRPPDTLPVPEYAFALRVGSVPTPRAVMQAVFPWRQDTPRATVITRIKFSLAERVPCLLYSQHSMKFRLVTAEFCTMDYEDSSAMTRPLSLQVSSNPSAFICAHFCLFRFLIQLWRCSPRVVAYHVVLTCV